MLRLLRTIHSEWALEWPLNLNARKHIGVHLCGIEGVISMKQRHIATLPTELQAVIAICPISHKVNRILDLALSNSSDDYGCL